MIDLLTRVVRTYLTGRDSEYVFRAHSTPTFQDVYKTNLYIHIPFCKNLCPYCPYNKVEYDAKLVGPYIHALLNEIDMYHALYGSIEISSIYIGGGTPTLLTDELEIVFEQLGERFQIAGDICIETSPNDLDADKVDKLQKYQVGLISLGVQSFQDRWLRLIGRKYQASILDGVIRVLVDGNFKSINIDLLFALPGQTVNDVRFDLQTAIDSGVNQVTTYPLFAFPYSTVGQYLKLKKVSMPKLGVRRRLYKFIHRYLLENGFSRVSVWGFKKGNVPRYSSVTRDNYIGLGPGAGSHMADGYYLNTFSVSEYTKRCLDGKFPIALHMPFNEIMECYFWLYWRLYDTYVPKEGLLKMPPRINRKMYALLGLLKVLGFLTEDGSSFQLNEKGAFWVHLAQNHFSLRYINTIWSVAMKEPYPEEIRF
jgi:coproporphyrinogen III oxidase-like Fe-S oxidoreductase